MTKILYVVDNKARVDRFIQYIKRCPAKGGLTFYICPITIDNDKIDKVRQEISAYGETVILPFIRRFHDNGFLYKDKFIQFLSDFSSGRKNGAISLRRYFAYPSGNFSAWWLSLIAEKNTAKNKMYHNFVKLITVLGFQDDYAIDKVYIDIEDNDLKKAIFGNNDKTKVIARVRPQNRLGINLAVYFIKALGYCALFVIRKIVLFIVSGRNIGKRIDLLKGTKSLLITFFPFTVDRELLKKNVFKNKVFGPLQESLEKRSKDTIAWIGIEKDYSGLNIQDINLAKKINGWGYNLFLEGELISFREMTCAFFTFLLLSLRFLIKIPYLSRNLIFQDKKRINLWDIFQDGWIYSFFGSNLIGGLLYYHFFLNIMTTIKKEAIVIYPSELQWWENALNIARKGNKRITTLGIQHSSVPLTFLSYFNSSVDLNSEDAFDAFPLPDYLATSGNIPSRLLVDSGWPEEKIFDIGAIKYHRLSRFLDQKIEWGRREKKVVVALSIIKEEIEEMLLMLFQSFRNENICTFIIRPHPATSFIEDIIKTSGMNSGGNKFILDVDTPLESLLITARAAIVSSSTVSLNAIACQCPVVIPRLSGMVDMNPLSHIVDGLVIYADSQDELRTAIRSVMDSKESPVEFSKCKSFFHEYFTIVENEDEYFLRLQKQINHPA